MTDFSNFATNSEILSAYIENITFEPWKKLDGEAAAISICNITSKQVLLLKGEHMTRLAYPIRTNFLKGGKVRATFAITSKTAAQFVKLENALKDRLGSSGMMKKAEIKSTFTSCVSAPSQKYPSHTVNFDFRVEAPKTILYTMVENPTEDGWHTVITDYMDVSKFSLMSLRISPTLLWKGNGKSAIKWMVKQAVVAYEDEIPPPVDEANIDVNWDELEDQEFLSEMANHSADFSAEKLVPKGLKAVKGAKVSALEDDTEVFNPKTTKKPAAKKKAVAEPSVDEDEEEEEVLAFGLAGTPNDKKPAAKKAAGTPHKRPRATKPIEPSELPEGKITLPSAGDALMEATASEEDS